MDRRLLDDRAMVLPSRRIWAPWAPLVAVFVTTPALANDEQVAAETLFVEARKLMGQGKHDEACPKLDQSQKLDPAVGTLLYLGECWEKAGKTASAWVTFREAQSAASRAGQVERAKAAAERVAALEPRLTRLTIIVAANARVPGLTIRRDAKEVVDGLWGSPVPVDPGSHTIEATAPGHDSLRATVEVRASSETFVVTPLSPTAAPAPAPASAAPPAVASEAGPSPVEPTTGATRPARDTRRTLALAVGGVGVAALAGGLFFGWSAKSKWGGTTDRCNAENVCTQGGFDDRQTARSRATVATVLSVVGVVGMTVGGGLYLSADTTPKGHTLVTYRGSF